MGIIEAGNIVDENFVGRTTPQSIVSEDLITPTEEEEGGVQGGVFSTILGVGSSFNMASQLNGKYYVPAGWNFIGYTLPYTFHIFPMLLGFFRPDLVGTPEDIAAIYPITEQHPEGYHNGNALISGHSVSSVNGLYIKEILDEYFIAVKNVSGQFASLYFSQIHVMNPGESFQVYVLKGGEYEWATLDINNQISPPITDYNGYINLFTDLTINLSQGWNYFCYNRQRKNQNISSLLFSMESDYPNLSSKFQVIKDIRGNFWTEEFNQLGNFEPGKGYMCYMIGAVDNFQFPLDDNAVDNSLIFSPTEPDFI